MQLAPCDLPWLMPEVMLRLRKRKDRRIMMPHSSRLEPMLALADVNSLILAFNEAPKHSSHFEISCEESLIESSRWRILAQLASKTWILKRILFELDFACSKRVYYCRIQDVFYFLNSFTQTVKFFFLSSTSCCPSTGRKALFFRTIHIFLPYRLLSQLIRFTSICQEKNASGENRTLTGYPTGS